MPKDRMRPRDTKSTSQSKIESAAHAPTFDDGTSRSRELGHGSHQPLPQLRKPECIMPAQRGDLRQVRAH